MLPALNVVQWAIGCVPLDALSAIAAHLRIPVSEVYGEEFRPGPLKVCATSAARHRGYGRILLTPFPERKYAPSRSWACATTHMSRRR
jgi:hypothetical protein